MTEYEGPFESITARNQPSILNVDLIGDFIDPLFRENLIWGYSEQVEETRPRNNLRSSRQNACRVSGLLLRWWSASPLESQSTESKVSDWEVLTERMEGRDLRSSRRSAWRVPQNHASLGHLATKFQCQYDLFIVRGSSLWADIHSSRRSACQESRLHWDLASRGHQSTKYRFSMIWQAKQSRDLFFGHAVVRLFCHRRSACHESRLERDLTSQVHQSTWILKQ